MLLRGSAGGENASLRTAAFFEKTAFCFVQTLAANVHVPNSLVDESGRQTLSCGVEALLELGPGLAFPTLHHALLRPHALLDLRPDKIVHHVQVWRSLGNLENFNLLLGLGSDASLREVVFEDVLAFEDVLVFVDELAFVYMLAFVVILAFLLKCSFCGCACLCGRPF